MEYYYEHPLPELRDYDIGFNLDKTRRRRRVIGAHVHTAVELLYLVRGEYLIEADGVQTLAYPGDMVIFRSNTIHSTYQLAEGGGAYYVLKLTSRFLLQAFRGGDDLLCARPFLQKREGDCVVYRAADISDEIVALWQRLIDEDSRQAPMRYAMEKAYALALIVQLYRSFFASECPAPALPANNRALALIHKSIDYINENYASSLDVGDCARMVNLSYSYYAKMFRTVTGKSFTAYLIDLRLAKAHSILLATDLPVTDVALSCGYKNPAHFTAEYKRHFGVTPRQTRKIAGRTGQN